MKDIRPIRWEGGSLHLLDQTQLPIQELWHRYTDPEKVAIAIEDMIVRGAPAIGVTAAFGLVLASKHQSFPSLAAAKTSFLKHCERFAQTRPTAVNLFWAIEQMKNCALGIEDISSWVSDLEMEAIKICEDDYASCVAIGNHGAELLKEKSTVLTHCNAGALATAGWGTALGVVRSAWEQGKIKRVFVDETRPFLQGSRLTAWELLEEEIPATLITDNMAAYFMATAEIDAIIVGADRIAANGDVANKIGTYALAVLAEAHKIPFFVAAPLSTIDLDCKDGSKIPIEQRDPKEVKQFQGHWSAPQAIEASHPAFDVSPNRLVSAIITEKGVARAPYDKSITKLF